MDQELQLRQTQTLSPRVMSSKNLKMKKFIEKLKEKQSLRKKPGPSKGD